MYVFAITMFNTHITININISSVVIGIINQIPHGINIPYMGKFWWGKILANLANHQLFNKISPSILTDMAKLYLAYLLTLPYFPNFSLPITFIYAVHQNFPHQIFPVYGNGSYQLYPCIPSVIKFLSVILIFQYCHEQL